MKALFYAPLLLIASFGAFADYTPPTSFRDIPFGSSASLLKGQSKIVEEVNGLKCYQKNKENLGIGDASLQEITYCYYKDQLFAVLVKFSGLTNYTIIGDVLNQKYGLGYRPNEHTEKYYWGLSDPVTINLEYSEVSKKGLLYYRHNQISKQKEDDQKDRNKKSIDDV